MVIDWSNCNARCWAGLGIVIIWKVVAALCRRRGSLVLRTMVDSSSSSVRKLCTGELSLSLRVATLSCAASDRAAAATGSRCFFALQVLVGKHQLAPRLAHVPLNIVGEHAQEDVRPHALLQTMMDGTDVQIDCARLNSATRMSIRYILTTMSTGITFRRRQAGQGFSRARLRKIGRYEY
jgi:hypothetical protein